VRLAIKPGDPDRIPPYEHLIPVVGALIASGNRLADSAAVDRQTSAGLQAGPYFYRTQGGWICLLADPIDFDLLRERFEFPSSVRLNEERDVIACDRTWIEIVGNWEKRDLSRSGEGL
jgi:hypothetical protein